MNEIVINGERYVIERLLGKVVAPKPKRRLRAKAGEPKTPLRIVSATGQEHLLAPANWNIAMRDGHELHVVRLIRDGESDGPYVAIHNRSTQEIAFASPPFGRVHPLFDPMWLFHLRYAQIWCKG